MGLQAPRGLGTIGPWRDVTASRNGATTYINTTGKPLLVWIWYGDGAPYVLQLRIDGVAHARNGGYPGGVSGAGTVFGIVPPGSSYDVIGGNPSSFNFWRELN